jgi:hypothetical protein
MPKMERRIRIILCEEIMTTFLLLLSAIGLAPLALGMAFLGPPAPGAKPLRLPTGSIILCTLAFNLTFFWQELWLVIPKALTAGLHPILYHNNHDWTGNSSRVELLQGTGALATLVSGLVFSAGLAVARRASVTWRLFLFWMAFQGLYQSLTQFAIGTMLPGNDVGRALGYLHAGAATKWLLLALSVIAMALVGVAFARACPSNVESGSTKLTRRFGQVMFVAAMLAIVLIIPFRLPRNIVEVALIPLFVNLVGVGWLTLGAAIVRRGATHEGNERAGVIGPAVALGATLLLFQLMLRPGVAF